MTRSFPTSEALLDALRAAAEPSRLRLLALCAEGELTVSDLTQILGQSQPRVSRHLKLLCDAGLLARVREGSWAFYRLARDGGQASALAAGVAAMIPVDDPQTALDRARLDQVRAQRAAAAQIYFSANAAEWNVLRGLHVDEAEVEAAVTAALGPLDGLSLLDVGAGTGRMLELLGPKLARGVGVDLSREMLAIARVALERAGLPQCSVRQGDIHQLPFPDAAFDVVTIHQVLHYLDDPAAALAEAARVLAPGGRLLVVDFAPHLLEELRAAHAHRRLGFTAEEVAAWMRAAGIEPAPTRKLPGAPLTVLVWRGERPAVAASPSTSSFVPAPQPESAP